MRHRLVPIGFVRFTSMALLDDVASGISIGSKRYSAFENIELSITSFLQA